MPNRPPRLGKMQYRILQILWEQGPCTARQITDVLSQNESVAHSTVQTLLRQLEAKETITHAPVERTFVYRPLVEPSEVMATPLHDLLMRVYQGSVYNMMSHLLKDETVSPEELQRIKQLIEEENRP